MSVVEMSMSLRQRNKEDKLQRIRAAAWELFESQGFAETTTRQICERADIGAGTLFSYVDDKGDLLIWLWSERFGQIMDDRFASLPAAGLAEQLMHVYRGFLAFYAERPALGREILPELMVLEGRKVERMATLQWTFTARCAGLIDAARARGEVLPQAPAEIAAHTIFGAYLVGLAALLNGFVPDLDAAAALLRAQIDVVVSGIGTREG
jgi:AcrR family transcriptional regulator